MGNGRTVGDGVPRPSDQVVDLAAQRQREGRGVAASRTAGNDPDPQSAGRRGSRVDWVELLVVAVGALWQWRLWVLALFAVLATHRMVARAGGETTATLFVAMLGVGAVAVAPARRLLWLALRSSSLRRAWERAAADAGLSDGLWRGPRMLGVRAISAGDVLRVRVRPGGSRSPRLRRAQRSWRRACASARCGW